MCKYLNGPILKLLKSKRSGAKFCFGAAGHGPKFQFIFLAEPEKSGPSRPLLMCNNVHSTMMIYCICNAKFLDLTSDPYDTTGSLTGKEVINEFYTKCNLLIPLP